MMVVCGSDGDAVGGVGVRAKETYRVKGNETF